jgi:integrase
MPYIGHHALSQVHIGTLERFMKDRLNAGRAPTTIDRDLAPVRRVLTLAARLWRDESGRPWLRTEPPLIKVSELQHYVQRAAHVLTWGEQRDVLALLPAHLARMALFKVNTGTREQEVVQLRWEWEIKGHHAFLVPSSYIKNKLDRLIVCNSVAWSVVESQRHGHSTHVFTYKGRPVGRIYNTAWKRARKRAEIPHLRVHDLKHTFGFRLRAANVDPMDRKDLLGHKNTDISRLYSAPSIERLLEAAEKVVDLREPVLRVVGRSEKSPQKSPQSVAFSHHTTR